MSAKTNSIVITPSAVKEFENKLIIALVGLSLKKTDNAREAIAEGVGFIQNFGGALKGRKASKGKAKILSTREALIAAYIGSGFATSDSAAKNYADIALLVFSGGVDGVDVSGLTPHASKKVVRDSLLPDAIKVGQFIALVRSEPKAKAKAKATDKPKATTTPKTDAEHFADILAGIRLINEFSPEQVKQIAEEVAAKSAE
tara:strand:+ start:688 stop:1290 length:603 start_codon:yes stop_codon:yes gene_type:complete